MNDFLNEYATNSMVLAAVGAATGMALALFSTVYNMHMDRRRERVYTAIYVVGGVLATLGGMAVISWKAAVLGLAAFAASGLPMVIGDMRRGVREQARQEQDKRRKRLPYAEKGLVDQALMEASEAERALGELVSKKELGMVDLMRLAARAILATANCIKFLSEIGRQV